MPEDPSEKISPKEGDFFSSNERFINFRERPPCIEVQRGIVEYYNDLVDYGRELKIAKGEDRQNLIRQTIFYHLIDKLWGANQKPVRLLDLGCGSGRFLKELKDLFGDKVEVHGVTARAYNQQGRPIWDNNEEQRFVEAQKRAGINIEVVDMCNLSNFEADYFDIVVSAEGINYAGDPIKVVEQAHRILKNGALMVAGPVAIQIEGMPIMLAGNHILHPKLDFSGMSLSTEIENTPLKADVICFKKNGPYKQPRIRFSHSRKNKNGSVYTTI